MRNSPNALEQGQIVLAHDACEFGDAGPGARTVAAHQGEEGRLTCAKRERGGVGKARDPRFHSLNERNRSVDLAKRPRNERQIDHRSDAGIRREAKRQIVVAAGLEQGERAFQFTQGFDKFAGEVVGHALDPMRDAGLARIGSRRDAGKEGCRMRSHRRELASHVATCPQAVIGRQSLGRVLVARGGLAGCCEGFRRFRRPIAAGGDERVAVGHLQVRQSLPARRFGPDFIGLRQRRQKRLRLGDLRHFRRRRNAFQRGRENGVGFGGAAGRLIEVGERERRAQFETAGALLLRDGDGGQEGVFRGRRIGGVALEEDFAARPMQFRFERAIAQAVGRRQRFVEDRDGAVRIARPGLGLSQRDLQ